MMEVPLEDAVEQQPEVESPSLRHFLSDVKDGGKDVSDPDAEAPEGEKEEDQKDGAFDRQPCTPSRASQDAHQEEGLENHDHED